MGATIEPSSSQQKCIEAAVRWHKTDPKKRKPFFRIEGSAGTGKTFVIKHIIAALPEEVRVRTQYCAPTGKAAQVMQSYGCVGATTVHRKIYTPKGNRTADKTVLHEMQSVLSVREKLLRAQNFTEDQLISDNEVKRLRRLIDQQEAMCQPLFAVNMESNLKGAALLVVSECSMIDEGMAKDLLSFDVPLLLEGDPYQLPPVFGKSYFMSGKADFSLSTIHRQAEGSPILELARQARMGSALKLGDYGEGCAVVSKLSQELALEADQIIVGRNLTRHRKNYKMRMAKGFIPLPGEVSSDDVHIPRTDEKLICLRNDNEAGLLNGSLWKCVEAHSFSDSKVKLTVESEDEVGFTYRGLCHAELLKGESQGSIPQWALMQKGMQQFDFGYAITAHKFQGSQSTFVIVYDESKQFPDSRKWLYTAVTRAQKRLIIVQQ